MDFDAQVDATALPAHLAGCLSSMGARGIKIVANRVAFTGGWFRGLANPNVLAPFGFGDLIVDPGSRQVRYRLSCRQLLIRATAMVVAAAAIILFKSGPWQALIFFPAGGLFG